MSDPRSTPSIFTRGAVDLSALRTPPPSPAADDAAGAPPSGGGPVPGLPGGGGAVVDVTEATFQTEVLERSLTTPVVIEFWSPRSESSKQLATVLEKLAIEGNGAWVFARVDADSNPRLADALQLPGIPAAFVALSGRLAPGFTGAVPESQLRPFIAEVLQAAGVQVETPADPRLEAADDALMNGDLEGAEQAYRKILAESPADAIAEAGLAQVGLLRRIEGVDPSAVLAAAAATPDDIPAQTLAADIEVVSGQAEAAYKRLVDLVRRTFGADRESVRQHLVSLFTIAGPDDPAVIAARRALASALF
ncbi:tetratricopeptide repeat protein [Rugosimonospora africana]|uniref:Co-chaperone YbbN n=1 Tax=Rugosimonospora africana TaxID=556532 RepID=A0A8J3QQB8_9ACTN|nr:tetratricopeptide repeat protein [Rugosimonospora africana]GIH13508.1 co-chaperone YbbN [Rugosimonospora africana]